MRRTLVIAALSLSLIGAAHGQQSKPGQPVKAPAKVPHEAPSSTLSQPGTTPPQTTQATGQTSAIPATAATPAAQVENYLNLLAAGDPFKAVDECFDIREFAVRIYGEEFVKLDPSRAAYVRQLVSIAMKTTFTAVHMERIVKEAKRGPLRPSETGDDARVSYTLTFPPSLLSSPAAAKGGNTPELHLYEVALHRTRLGWKIVEIEPICSTWRKSWELTKETDARVVEFSEGFAFGAFQLKFGSLADPTIRTDAMVGNIQCQLDALGNQIELFKARTNKYPDFAASGWKELTDGGYLKSAPVNPVNGRSEIATGRMRAGAKYGWRWDAKTGTITAYGFDEKTGRLTLDRPTAAAPANPATLEEKYREYTELSKASSCKGTLGLVRSAIANFYANAAVSGQAKYPTIEELKKAGIVVQETVGPNPFNGDSTIAPAKWGQKPPVGGTHGWNYDPEQGRFWANTSEVGENGW